MGQAMPESAQHRIPRSRSGRSTRLRSSATSSRRRLGAGRAVAGAVGRAEVTDSIQDTVSAVYVAESRRVLATLIRLLGDFDVAEEAMHDAFRAALEQWPREGRAGEPARLARLGRPVQGDRRPAPARPFRIARPARRQDRRRRCDDDAAWADDESVEDDRLRLIFTCCHPALAPDAQVALTLREVCGLTTEEIAQAFLTPASTLAQRIVRAKAKIRDARHPVPGAGAGRAARSARRRASGHLSRVQRGLLGQLRRVR